MRTLPTSVHCRMYTHTHFGLHFTALRALRALRSISFIRALRVLVNALIKTLWSIINLLAVLLLIMYVFAIMGFYFFGPGESETHASADQWGSIDTTMFILFDYVTADGWTQFSSELDDRGLKLARFYTVTFIFIGHFIFTNLFIGVIINVRLSTYVS